MSKIEINGKIRLYFEIILLAQLVFTFFLQQYLYPIRLQPQYFLFLQMPVEFIVLINLFNTFLIFVIGRHIFGNYFSLLPSAIYAISPWGNYLASVGSVYILVLFLTLLIIVIYLTMKAKNLRIVSIFLIVIIIFVFLKDKIQIFSDPGLINDVENFQVEAGDERLGVLAQISENRYLNSLEYVFLKYFKNLTPSTFFTASEKLLGFSWSPPIYFGFVIPFFYGLYLILKKMELRKYLLISTVLVIPSLLSNRLVDLNRLITFFPMVILIVSYGLISMTKKRGIRVFSFFLILFSLLLTFQMIMTFTDITTREINRYERYFENHYRLSL